MEGDPVTFQPHEEAEKVARTFERDDLLSAAVIDADGKLIGRLTIDEIVDVVYEETDNDLRRMGGLSDEEDVFAPVSKAVKPAGHGWRSICVRRLLLPGSSTASNTPFHSWWRWPR